MHMAKTKVSVTMGKEENRYLRHHGLEFSPSYTFWMPLGTWTSKQPLPARALLLPCSSPGYLCLPAYVLPVKMEMEMVIQQYEKAKVIQDEQLERLTQICQEQGVTHCHFQFCPGLRALVGPKATGC